MNTHAPLLWLGDDPALVRPAAWQTRWARAHGAQAVLQHADPMPLRGDWLVQLESVVRSLPRCRLIAQGLGCALLAAWAAYSASYVRVDAALLLGPYCPDAADPSGRYRTWRAVTPQPLPFPTCVMPDPSAHSPLLMQQQWAQRWHSHWFPSLDPGGQREAMEAWLHETSAQQAFL
jgi:predicted alpha/beta hydrolase family esterase